MLTIGFRRISFVNLGVLFCIFIIGLTSSNKAHSESADGEISRALFTTKLVKNEPENEVLIMENDNYNLYYFSEVKNMHGKTIYHHWEYRGEKVFEQKFNVSKKSEKLISRYRLDPLKTGEWMVVITDEQGWPIKATMFKYVKKGSFVGKGVLPIKH